MMFRASLVAALLAFAGPASAQAPDGWRHGVSLMGDVKYPADFKHFDYVNPDAPKGGRVRLGAFGGFDSFNGFIPRGSEAAGLDLVYDTLMASSSDEPSTAYGLIAEAVKYPADFSSVTFRLRPEARFNDGAPVTAADVVWSFDTLKRISPLLSRYYADVTKAEATGEREVTFTFSGPGNRELPQIVGQLQVLPKHFWEGTDDKGRKRNIEEGSLEKPLGSGPYRIRDFAPGRWISYERVSDYWGAKLPVRVGTNNFDEIRWDYFRDTTVLVEAFKGDQFDYREENSAKNWATAYAFPAVEQKRVVLEQFKDSQSGRMQGFAFNIRREKFADPRVQPRVRFRGDQPDHHVRPICPDRQLFLRDRARLEGASGGPREGNSGERQGQDSGGGLHDALREPCRRVPRRRAQESARGGGAAEAGRLDGLPRRRQAGAEKRQGRAVHGRVHLWRPERRTHPELLCARAGAAGRRGPAAPARRQPVHQPHPIVRFRRRHPGLGPVALPWQRAARPVGLRLGRHPRRAERRGHQGCRDRRAGRPRDLRERPPGACGRDPRARPRAARAQLRRPAILQRRRPHRPLGPVFEAHHPAAGRLAVPDPVVVGRGEGQGLGWTVLSKLRATLPSPSPLAGEGKGEGALQNETLCSMPSAPSSGRASPGHLLPNEVGFSRLRISAWLRSGTPDLSGEKGRTRREALLYAGAAAAVGLFASRARADEGVPAAAGAVDGDPKAFGPERHGLSAFGELRYPADFKHFDYVNPAAPKGGAFSQIPSNRALNQSFTTFNTLNAYVLKGDGAQGMDLVFDTLMARADDEPDALYGLVAKSVAVSGDGLAYRFTLRPEARFHDGSRLTAEDVKWSLETLKAKGHPLIAQSIRDLERVDVDAPEIVTLRLSPKRTRDLPLTLAALPIFSKAYYSAKPFDASSLEAPLGSGPYRVGRFEQGRFIAFERVADYWAKDLPVSVGKWNFDQMRFDFFRDRDVGFEAFKARAYLFREEFTSRTWATGYDFPGVRENRVVRETLPDLTPSGGQGWFFNLRRAKFQDIRVRQALNLAFDFEWMNKSLMFGAYKRTVSVFQGAPEMMATGGAQGPELALLEPFRGKVSDGVFDAPPVPAVSDGSGQDRNLLRQAQRLLREAGYAAKDGRAVDAAGEPLTIEFLEFDPGLQPHVSAFIKNLKVIGVEAQIRNVDAAQYQSRMNAFDYDVVSQRMSMSSTPGEGLRQVYSSESATVQGSQNLSGIADPAVDAMVEAILSAKSRDELNVACRALDRVLRSLSFWVPAWYKGSHTLAYWDAFSHPAEKPRYARGAPELWWWDQAKAEKAGVKA